MKLKTAFALSLIVNAVFIMAVGVLLVTDIEPAATPPLFLSGTNAPASVTDSIALVQ